MVKPRLIYSHDFPSERKLHLYGLNHLQIEILWDNVRQIILNGAWWLPVDGIYGLENDGFSDDKPLDSGEVLDMY